MTFGCTDKDLRIVLLARSRRINATFFFMDRFNEDLYSLSEESAGAQVSSSRSASTVADNRSGGSGGGRGESVPLKEHNDSGVGIELSPEEDICFYHQFRSGIGSRERSPHGSGESSTSSTQSRGQRCRNSLRRFRQRSGEFIQKRIRPSCLRPVTAARGSGEEELDEGDHVTMTSSVVGTRRRWRVNSFPAVRSSLTVRQDEFNSATPPRRLRHSMHSSPSSITIHSVEDRGIIWINSNTESRQMTPSTSAETLSGTYGQVLRSIINPLGCADKKPRFTPIELALHLRDIFQFDQLRHEALIEEVRNVKPTNVVVNVTVIEARDLKPCPSVEYTNPYCVLGIDTLHSPRNSPASSPRTSPTSRRRSVVSADSTIDETMQTDSVLASVNPQWKEHFELPVKILNSEVLHLFITNSSTQSSTAELERFRVRKPSLKGLFRHIRTSMDNSCRNNANHMGEVRIPLKDIPASGCDTWFQLYKDKRQRFTQQGQCRLRLQLSYRRKDSASMIEHSIQEFHEVVQEVYKHALLNSTPRSSSQEVTAMMSEPLGRISERSQTILNLFAVQSGINSLTQHIIELAVLLELKADPSFLVPVTEKLLRDQIAIVVEECKQSSAGVDLSITDTEGSILDEAIGKYLRTVRVNMRPKSPLFPARDLKMEELNEQIGTPMSLLCLPLWTNAQDNSEARQSFTSVFIQRLQDDVRNWLAGKLETVTSSEKDPVIPKTQIFVSILHEASLVLSPIVSITDYFMKLGFDYFKVASMTIEVKLSSVAQELALEMDRYQLKYHRFDVNIRDSSVVSLQHHFALRAIFKTIRGNVSEREIFRISMSRYQQWFKGSVTFWLQTFREECEKRMEKALSLDKDVVQVTSLVKYSNSSVDILSSFAKMTGEWQQIEFEDADIALLGATKITDMICDCVKLYTEKVIAILENNGYYDYIDNQQFDVTDQLCISLNNICHLRGYLVELSTLLNWELVTQQLSIKHEDEAVGKKAMETLQSLVTCTEEEMMHTGRILSQQIIERIAIDQKKYTMMFTRSTTAVTSIDDKKPHEVEPLLEYLENNLKVLYKKLESSIFPLFLEEIWKAQIRIFTETVMEGQSPQYYEKMLLHLEEVRNYFHRCGIEECATAACKMYNKLLKLLNASSQTSEALMLQYYKSLTGAVTTPVEYYGHLVVKVGYRQETDGFLTVYATVIQAKYLPGLSSKDLASPLVSVTLCPLTLFPGQYQQKTKVHTATINPLYNETFEFGGISAESLRTDGAVIIFSTWHHVSFLPNDFLGEIVVSLPSIREININQNIEDLPAVMMPLRRPKEPRDGPFKVLKERSVNDKTAALLINQRMTTVTFNSRCRLCRPMKSIVSTITGKRLDSVG